MKKLFLLILTFALVFPLAFSEENASAQKDRIVIPSIVSQSASSVVGMAPTRWPVFTRASSDNQACFDNLKLNYSGKRRNGASYVGTTDPYIPGPADYSTQLLTKTINLSNLGLGDYRSTMRIFVTWTTRLVAVPVRINPWGSAHNPRLCSPWHGTSYHRSNPNNAYTALFVNGSKKSEAAVMTIPGTGEVRTSNPSDPTITGSVTLVPEDFGGTFPNQITFKVKAYNDTSMRVKTEGERNLVINIMPVN
ncbi:MAG: hypothetical protein K9L61_01485 [Candidatus Omnitrophica bacterium]|nr:hypothetical protein [Candidatus Omnitrophota bacterium]